MLTDPKFLFAVDLEDVRLRMTDGLKYNARVEVLVDKYLSFLNTYNSKATFFTVGDIPKYYPGLIKRIAQEGHEIACHSNLHIPVAEQSRDEFNTDLLRNIESLNNAGASAIKGYRAPVFSITPQTPWAFEVLTERGFTYSSSILPAKNPLFGWENFGNEPRKMKEGIWEIPMTLLKNSFLTVPFAGGTYFRVLPMALIKKSFRNYFDENKAVPGYFHPYDVDVEQEKFFHPGINNSWFYNKLMYYNRSTVFERLDEIMKTFNAKIITYSRYTELLNSQL